MRLPLSARAVGALLVFMLAGCGLTVPADPDGTLDRVTGGTLRVGVSPNGDFVRIENGRPSGSDVESIESFAAFIDADIEWTIASEEVLVRGLERGDLDVVAAGLTDATPWVDKAGVTRPYDEAMDAEGTRHKIVMLVPLGENAFLTSLETFLTEGD